MSTVKEIFDALCALAPLELQMDFDNSGFLVGHGDTRVERVLLALDITGEVIDEAVSEGARLIVSHHPVIFGSLRAVTDSGDGALVLRLVENDIAAICMHTNLDIAEGGVNDVLMETLGIDVSATLSEDGCGRIGVLPEPQPLEDFLQGCKAALKAKGLRYYDAGRSVEKIAVMGGAGGDYIKDACAAGCDTYLSSDIKYHQFLQAMEIGINLIDADHFCTENPVIPVLAERLRKCFPDVQFLVSKRHRQRISFL